MAQALSVIVPANNEAAWIGACLGALAAQEAAAWPLRVIVAANGCSDDTAAIARTHEGAFAAKGGELVVLDLPEGGKTGALNRAEAEAGQGPRAFLDADVLCDPALLGQIRAALSTEAPRYATGTLAVRPGKSLATRLYAGVWQRLPFVRGGAVGAGFFAVNPAGRARWGAFPKIISDDTFVRLQFAPGERIEVPARYHWPMVEGLAALIRVRRRQDAGVAEIDRLWPGLRARTEGKPPPRRAALAGLALTRPLGFALYALVHVAVRLRKPAAEWTRGR